MGDIEDYLAIFAVILISHEIPQGARRYFIFAILVIASVLALSKF